MNDCNARQMPPVFYSVGKGRETGGREELRLQLHIEFHVNFVFYYYDL